MTGRFCMNSSMKILKLNSVSEPRYNYCQVQPEQLPAVWREVKPLIERAMDTARGEANSEHFRRSIERGTMDLFIATDSSRIVAAMVTQFDRHAIYTAFRICILAGTELDVLEASIREYWPALLEWAYVRGATKAEALCHPGMARLLRQYGFRDRYSLVAMDIDTGEHHG